MGHQAVVLICSFLAITFALCPRRKGDAGMALQIRNVVRTAFPSIALVAVTACGGSGSTPQPPPPAMYSIGGTVSGLNAGQSVVLQLNGGNDLTVDTNVAFHFATKVSLGSAYAVTVVGAPAGKTCTAYGGAGWASANVTDVVVDCAVTFSIGGAVSGLIGQGLELAVDIFRHDYEGGHFYFVDKLGIDTNGHFVFATPLYSAATYHIRVLMQPHSPAQRCVLQNVDFFIATANVTDVEVVCSEFAYVTSAAGNTISAFSVDATTGAIASVGPPVSTGLLPLAIAGTSNKKYVYVVNSGSNDISAYSVDSGTGALTAVPGSPFTAGTNPRSLALYFDSLYVANSGSSDISVYQIDQSTGVLTPYSPATFATGAGPSAIAFDPIYGSLYTANTGDSNISAFGIGDGLGPVAGSPFLAGSNISSLAFGANGNFLYAADASGAAAAIYGYTVKPFGWLPTQPDPSSGALSPLVGSPYPLPACKFIAADQTGAYLYATTGTELFGYRIDATTGALTPLSGFPIAVGTDARSMSIDPANQFLYVANGSAGTVTSFALNSATGDLAPMPGSPFAVGASVDYIATF